MKENSNERELQSSLTPFQVVLLHELELWNILCKQMALTLSLLAKALEGEGRMTSQLEDMEETLSNGLVPTCWQNLAPSTNMKLGSWISHFVKRYDQYVDWIERFAEKPTIIWLGGLHVPQSFLSALVQFNAKQCGWSLEQCSLFTEVSNFKNVDEVKYLGNENEQQHDACFLYGIYLEGAAWDLKEGHLKMQEPKKLVVDLPLVLVRVVENGSYLFKKKNLFRAPVYATSDRRNSTGEGLIFHSYLNSNHHDSIWTLKGVALILNLSE